MPKPLPTPDSPAEEVALLRERIAESGLSITKFAVGTLRRDVRTVRRWLSGESPIPRLIVEFLVAPSRAQWP